LKLKWKKNEVNYIGKKRVALIRKAWDEQKDMYCKEIIFALAYLQ
jgi:hypothetical protein